MCQPCKDSNVQLTEAKDVIHLGTDPEIDDLVESFMSDPATRVPGCAIGVVHDNQVVYLKGYGLADVETNRAFTIATPSAIGSISKTVTALAALRLLGQNGLDASVGSHLPFAPPSWADITVHQLLSHTSGLPRDPGSPEWEYPSTEQDLIDALGDAVGDHPGGHPRHAYWMLRAFDPVPFESGSSARYSNLGYALLGAIIDFETVNTVFSQDVGYERYVHGEIGLNGGLLSEPTMITPCLNAYWRSDEIFNLARGYRLDDDDDFVEVASDSTGPYGTAWWRPAGGWTMTIGDLARLMLVINTNARIDQELTTTMLTQHGQDAAVGDFGYGVFLVDKIGAPPAFQHGGDIDGYTARFVMWHGEGTGVAVLCNRRDSDGFGSGSLGALTDGIGALVRQRGGVQLRPTLADRERERSVLLRAAKQHDRQVARLLELYAFKHGSLEAAFLPEARRLNRNQHGRQLLRALRSGDLESAARAGVRLLEARRSPGDTVTLPPPPPER